MPWTPPEATAVAEPPAWEPPEAKAWTPPEAVDADILAGADELAASPVTPTTSLPELITPAQPVAGPNIEGAGYVEKPLQFTEQETALGQLAKGNIPGAVGTAAGTVRESLSPILGPTEEQISAESVPWGTNPDGSVKYEYKPLADLVTRKGIFATPEMFDLPPIPPDPNDPAWKAALKAGTNQAAAFAKFGMSPGGVLMTAMGGAGGLARSASGLAPAGLGAESAGATQIASTLTNAGKGAAGFFAVDMAAAAPEQFEQAFNAPTLQGKIEGWIGAVSSLGFSALATKHATGKALTPAESGKVESVAEMAKRAPDDVLEAVAQPRNNFDVYSQAIAQNELIRRFKEQQAALAPEATAAAEVAATTLPSGKAGPPDLVATAAGAVKTAEAAAAAGKPFEPNIEGPITEAQYGRTLDAFDVTAGMERKPSSPAPSGTPIPEQPPSVAGALSPEPTLAAGLTKSEINEARNAATKERNESASVAIDRLFGLLKSGKEGAVDRDALYTEASNAAQERWNEITDGIISEAGVDLKKWRDISEEISKTDPRYKGEVERITNEFEKDENFQESYTGDNPNPTPREAAEYVVARNLGNKNPLVQAINGLQVWLNFNSGGEPVVGIGKGGYEVAIAELKSRLKPALESENESIRSDANKLLSQYEKVFSPEPTRTEPSPVATPAAAVPKLREGQGQGNLIEGEDLTLVGERVRSEAPKPKGPEPTVQQTISDALDAYGDLPSAWEHLDSQVKALEGDKANKASITRLNAAKRKIENTMEEEARRAEIEDVESFNTGLYELESSIKELGGIATTTGKGKGSGGELSRIAEARKGALLKLFRKNAPSHDTLREGLEERGFQFATPDEMFMALEDSMRSGKKLYGSQFPEGYTGGPGAMGPVEAAYQAASRKILGGYNADVEAAQIRRGQVPTVSEARKEDPVTFENAMDAIEKNPALPEKLVDDILKKEKKSITDEEQQMLTYRRAELENKMAAESERAIDPSLTPEQQAVHQTNAEVFEAQLLRAEEANRMAGTASGRALRSRQMQMNDDYTYAGLMMRERRATGEVVPKERAAELRKTAEEIKKAQAEVDRLVEESQKKEEEAAVDSVLAAAIADREAQQQAAQRSGDLPYHPSILARAEEIVKGIESKRDELRAKVDWRQLFGSESGAIGGIGGPKGEGKPIGSRKKAASNRANAAAAVEYLAYEIAAHISRFGVNRAKTLEVMLGRFDDSIKPFFGKAYDAAQKIVGGKTKSEKPKVAEAVKTGATAPEKQPKPPKSKDTLVGEGRAAVEKGEGLHNVVAQIVDGMIDAGNRDRADIFKRTTKIVQEFMPEATERDVNRAYVDYGKKSYPNPDEAAAFKRKTRQVKKIGEDIDRLKEKMRPELQGYQREKLDLELRDLVKRRSELLKDPSLPQEPGAFASKDEAKQTRIKNRIEELDRYLKTGEKPVESKPTQPDSAITEQLRAEKEALEAYVKEVDAAKNPPLSDAQKALDSAMIARERAGQTLDDISTGKVKDPAKIKEALTQLEEDVRLETDALKALAAEMRRDAKPKGDPGYLKEQAQIKALERAIASYAEKVAKGDLAGKGKVQGPDSRRVAQLKAIRDSRRAAYQAARDAGKPVRSPEQRWNATRLKALTKREADFAEKIRTGQYARPPKKVPPKMDAPTQDAQIRVDAIKQKFLKEQFDYYQKQRATSKKIVDGIGQTLRAGINIVSSTDLSGFRQGMGTTMMALGKTVFPVDVRRGSSGKAQVVLTNPLKSAMMILRPGAKMIVSGISEQKARRMEKARENRPNAKSGAYDEMGIDQTTLDTKVRSKHEEMMYSVLDEWAQLPMRTGSTGKTIITAPGKVAAKVVHASNRAFNTLLNEMRLDLADSLLAENYKDRAPTSAELKVLGNLVNIATGRGNINPTLARGAGFVFWAPSLFASRVKGLTMEPIWSIKQPFKGTGRARAAVAKEYARVIISGYLLWKTAQMFSDDDADTTNPTSSDFGKIVRGNTRIDPWGGHQQVGVLAARAITGKTTSIKGEERENDLGAVIASFGRNKLRPDWGALWNAYEIYLEKPRPGRPQTYSDVVASMYTPMSLRDIADVMRDRGMAEGAIVEALGMFGAGVSVYGDEDEVRGSR